MGNFSETTFGQKYTKAGELVEVLNAIPTYAPGVTELEPAEIKAFLITVDSANSDVASKLSDLQTNRDARYNAYKNGNGLLKRCSQVRDYIASVHPEHKKALDYKKVQKYVQSLRGKRLSKKPVNPDGSPAKTVSTSERSYGSMLRIGKDILEVIKTFPGYLPSNNDLTIANFTTFLNSLDVQNSTVAAKQEAFENSAEVRRNLYKDLKKKISKVKFSIAAQFGRDSNEYKDVVKY
jgi:hypothetical protein